MALCNYVRVLGVWCIIGFAGLHAETLSHPFEVESGVVSYEISSEAVLTPDTNLSILGTEKLRFSDWGDVRVEEEEGRIQTFGALRHQHEVKHFKKYTKDSVITVDYQNEQLLERKNATGESMDEKTRFLTHTGQEEVAGILCDVWEGVGVKKYTYKGLVLGSEITLFGVTYTKKAKSVMFDVNVSKEDYKTPDYPLQEFALIRNNIATQNSANPQPFSVVLAQAVQDINENNTSHSENNSTDEERMKFINHLGENIYKRQKELLPALLISLKETRECLQTAKSAIAANECTQRLSELKMESAQEGEMYVLLWDEHQKSSLLDRIEEELIDLESHMVCINRTQNITDLSNCMK